MNEMQRAKLRKYGKEYKREQRKAWLLAGIIQPRTDADRRVLAEQRSGEAWLLGAAA